MIFLARSSPSDLTGHHRARLGAHNFSGAGRNRQHVAELNFAVFAASLSFKAEHVSGRHSVLLSTSADDRVHTPASVVSPAQLWYNRVERAPSPANPQGILILCLLFFPAPALPTFADGPRTGPQVQANSTILA